MKALILTTLRPWIGLMLAASALVILGSFATLVVPWGLGLIIGNIVDPAAGIPPVLILGTFAAISAQSLLTLWSARLGKRISANVLADLRIAVFGHVLRLPLDYHERHPRGDAIALLSRDIETIGDFSTSFVSRVAPSLVTLAGASIMMLRIDPVLAAPILLAIPVTIIALKLQVRRLRPAAMEMREREAKVLTDIEESLTMVPTIKRFTREDFESDRYQKDVFAARDMGIRVHRSFVSLVPSVQVFAGAAMLMVLLLLQSRLETLGLTTAEWTSLLLYAGLIIRPLSTLAGTWGETQLARGAAARLSATLELRAERSEGVPGPKNTSPGTISFRKVSYAYAGGRPALSDLSLEIDRGERVALIGPNGSGKSTLVRLLCGLQFPDEGIVEVNGVPTTEFDLSELRRSVSVVPQEVQLVNGTIRDNIAYGFPSAPDALVFEAARSALADGFISTLDDGYDTVVGENGVWLSGGQRQRIALARALLGNPGIVVLDEATAMFDIDSEQAFFAALDRAFEGRTVIVIAHTRTAFDAVDRVIELRAGTLHSSGQ